MTRTLQFSRICVLALTVSSLLVGPVWRGMFASAQSRRASLGTFNPPPNWQVENLKISSETEAGPQSVRDTLQPTAKVNNLPNREEQILVFEGPSLALSIAPKAPTFSYEVTSFLDQRSLTLSSDAVRISSDRGELIARNLKSATTPTDLYEKTIDFVIYGNVDGNDYAYHYQFVYNDQSRRMLRASATTLRGDGYEVNYESGESFQLTGNSDAKNSKFDGSIEIAFAGSPLSVANTTPGDIRCILENLQMCSTYLDLVLCVVTLGTTCLDAFLRNILLNLACGITATCKPLPSFSLSTGSSSLTVRRGQSGNVSVQAAFTGGFSGPVAGFKVTNLPSGVSAVFSPGTITSNGGKINLNLAASATAQTGSRVLTISATAGGMTKTTTTELKVDNGRGTIQINATLNGSAWTGNLAWGLTGSAVSGGTSVPRTITDLPAGAYGLTFLLGGPTKAAFVGISPVSQTLAAGTTATFTVNFVTAPTGPSNLTGSASSSSKVSLSWNDNSNNETEFRVERKRTTSGSWSEIARVGSNARTYVNSGLNSNTTYVYRVRAANQAGPSGYSNERSVTTRK